MNIRKRTVHRLFALIMAVVLVCTSITTSAAPASALKVGSTFTSGKYKYKVTALKGKTGSVSLIGAKNKSIASVTIPDTVKTGKYTLKVTAIANGAFKGYKKLKSVTTNAGLKQIGKNAFSGCARLAKINIEGTKLTNVGSGALKGISKAAVIEVPDGTQAVYAKRLKNKGQAKTVAVAVTANAEVQKQTEAQKQAEMQKQTETQKPVSVQSVAPKAEAAAKATADVTDAAKPQEAEAQNAETQPAASNAAETPKQTETEAVSGKTAAVAEMPAAAEPKAASQTEEPKAAEANAPETEAPRKEMPKTYPQKDGKAYEIPRNEQPETEQPDTSAADSANPDVNAQETEETNTETTEPSVTAPETEETETTEPDAALPETTESETETETVEPETPHQHEYNEWQITKPATCTDEGEQTKSCKYCGETVKETIPALEHDMVMKAAVVATCFSEGRSTYQACTRCGFATEPAVTPKLDHVPVVKAGTEPTCTEPGFGEYTVCRNCSAVLESGEYKPAKGHSFDAWTIVTASSCTEAGTETRTCADCGVKETQTIPAEGHSFGAWKREHVPMSNCYDRNVRECGVCHYVEKSNAPVHRTDVLTDLDDIEPTCTAYGKKNRTKCPHCGLENFSYVRPLGHEYSSDVTVEAGNCVKATVSYQKCTRCDAKKNVTEIKEPAGHQWTELVEEATCTEAGFKGNVCSLCGTREGTVIRPAGHKKTITTVKPTCGKDGVTTISCSVCGQTERTTLPAVGEHKWVKHEKVEATCVKDGRTEYTQCSICKAYQDDKQPEVIPATGVHTFQPVPGYDADVDETSFSSVQGDALGLPEMEEVLMEADHLNSLSGTGRFTSFGKKCANCGYYVITRPGSGGLTKADVKPNHICWIIFLTEGEWGEDCNKNYGGHIIMNNKTYAFYAVMVNPGKKEDDEAVMKVIKERAGKLGIQNWKAAKMSGGDISFENSKSLDSFDVGDIGKTFLAAND